MQVGLFALEVVVRFFSLGNRRLLRKRHLYHVEGNCLFREKSFILQKATFYFCRQKTQFVWPIIVIL